MSSLSTFINLLDQFLIELVETFPEHAKFKVYYSNFELLKETNSRKILDKFMSEISPYSEYIINKNEELFNIECELNNKLEINKVWNSDISDNTKGAIWAHLNTLYVFGSTINMIPENMMSSIESLAQQCASNFEGTDQDPALLMKGMQNMMLNMPK